MAQPDLPEVPVRIQFGDSEPVEVGYVADPVEMSDFLAGVANTLRAIRHPYVPVDFPPCETCGGLPDDPQHSEEGEA